MGLTVFVMYQVVANYVITYGSKGELYDQGVRSMDKGQFTEALEKAELSIKARENQAESFLLRANALYALDRQSEAQSDLQLVAKVKPQLAFDLHHKAFLLIRDDGTPSDVVRLESLAMAINPNVPKFYVNRAYAYTDLNQDQRAIDDCTFALAIRPIDADVSTSLLQNRANAYNCAHRYKEALQDSELALKGTIKNEDDHWRIFHGKVDALIGLKRFAEALATCDEAMELIADDKPWLIDFNELKISALKARNDKKPKDSEQISRLQLETKRLESALATEKREGQEERNAR
jgi:tetratricopeptide (TPR) repeat protein